MARRQVPSQMDQSLTQRLAHLDLRTWVIDYLRWPQWGLRREFTLLTSASVTLVEATSAPGAPIVLSEIDRGELVVTSRRICVTGRAFVRSVLLADIVGWSFGDTSFSIGGAGADRVWSVAECTQADAFLTAVIINLSENFLGDDVPGLDYVTSDDIETYIAAFERDEVEPARQQVAQTAASLEEWRRVNGLG